MFWIFTLGIFLQDLVLATAANTYNCLDSDKNKFNLSCNGASQIFSVNVTSATGVCDQNSCTGYTPQLINQKLNCYWKNNCTVDLPQDIIIQSFDESSTCFGNKPGILVLYSWKCTNEGVIIYDFKERANLDVSFDSGIIRSHSRFPWDYSFLDFTKPDYKASAYSRNVTFWLKPVFTLILTIDKVSVTNPDSLTWYTTKNDMRNPVSMGTNYFPGSEFEVVYLELNISNSSEGDSGFLLCYTYSSGSNTIKNACDDMTTTHYKPETLKSTKETSTQKPKGGGKKKVKNKTEKGERKKNRESKTNGKKNKSTG